MSKREAKVYPPASGKELRKRGYWDGRVDWFYVPVTTWKPVTDYYAFETKEQADQFYEAHQDQSTEA